MIFSAVVITSLLSLLSCASAAAVNAPAGIRFVCPDIDAAQHSLIPPSPVPTLLSHPSPLPTNPSGDDKSPNKPSDDGKSSNDGNTPSDGGKTTPSDGDKQSSDDGKFECLFCEYSSNDRCSYDKSTGDLITDKSTPNACLAKAKAV